MDVKFFKYIKSSCLLIMCAGLLLVFGCKETPVDPDPTPTGEVTNEEINRWVVDSMRYWYYWNITIPHDNNLNFTLAPEPFFETILNKPADRFSWIQKLKDLENSLSGVVTTSGLGFSFFRIGTNGAGMTIRYVHKGSPADLAGIKRGDIFILVNGQALTVDDEGYVQNYGPVIGSETFTITRGILSGNTISQGSDITLTPVENFQEKAIHLDTVLTTLSGTKVGYLFYNRFLWAQAQDLVDAFSRFKAEGVTELIIDERYNGGGSVSAAGLLSALIHKGFSISSPYVIFEYNNNFDTETYTYANVFGSANAGVVNANNLGLDRVFILATGGSASASELLINNLKPFMGDANVIHIGSPTYGKDEASITISNSSSRFEEDNDWGIQPTILKYKNKDGGGNFITGLVPTYQVSETVPFAPMGSAADPLIGRALTIIDPSMQAVIRQMGLERKDHSVFGLEELQDFNKELSYPRPADVTESLKGKGLILR